MTDNDQPAPEPPGPDYDEACSICGERIGDHTLQGYAEELRAAGHDYTLPQSEIPGGPLRFANVAGDFAGSVDVVAAYADTAIGRLPLLVFQFYGSDGNAGRIPFPPMNLVGDVPMMRDFAALVSASVDMAIRGSKEGKR